MTTNTKKIKMQKVIPFAELLKNGALWDFPKAVLASGYDRQFLYRLCRQKKIPHMRRGREIFFVPAVFMKAIFKDVPAVSSSAKNGKSK